MFPVSTNMAGMAFGMPDVCLVPAPPAPPIPTPFPNFAMHAMANPGTCSAKCFVQAGMTMNMGSMVMTTTGDEGGVAGGVMCGMMKGMARYNVGSMKLLVNGMPTIRMTSMSMQNLTNVPAGLVIAPDQVKVFCP